MIKDRYDVVILGGGLAGLCLARQLKRACPATSILVAEKRKHPAPEAAFKVGEATIEIGARYFSVVLGMSEHMQREQLLKLGLRIFFEAGDNGDIARRVELGPFSRLPVPAYQVDRGRFENALARQSPKLGVTFLDECKVTQISLDENQHAVRLLRDGEEITVKARWVVDASGRAGLLKHQLGLAREVDHNANAVWFRIGENIDVEDWSTDPRWRQRIFPGLRRFSTNHLMGRGYWVWLIPLASNSTSIGIVADAGLHPFQNLNRFDRALQWLWEHEPQCAKAIDDRRDRLQDFLVLRHYAHGCDQVFSANRWGITGEAGVFTDPLYSVGSDFIAISNSFIVDLIQRELDGQRIEERAAFYNRFYLDFWYPTVLRQYQHQYPLMGHAQVMTAKIVWDVATYWGVVGLLFFHDKLCDLTFLSAVEPDLWRLSRLNAQVQNFFRHWNEADRPEPGDLHRRGWRDAYVDYAKIEFLRELQSGMAANLKDDELKAKLAQNVNMFELIAADMFGKAARTLSGALPHGVLNPLAMSLPPRCRPADGVLSRLGGTVTTAEAVPGLGKLWFDSRLADTSRCSAKA
jgi:flavin-dependent dehydrogenase